MEIKESEQYYDIILTDIRLHAVEPTNPKPWYKVVDQSIRSKKPKRFYAKGLNVKEDGVVEFGLPIPPDLEKLMKTAQKMGKTLRILTPREGIPVYLSKDGQEKLVALKKSGWLDKILKVPKN